MPRRTALVLVLIVLGLHVFAARCHAGKFNPGIDVGDEGPSWDGLAGVDGKTHGLEDHRDAKLVVVAFIANVCPESQAYEDRIVSFAKDYAEKGVQLVGISVSNLPDDRLDQMKLRAEEKGFNFPYLHDPSQQIGRAYRARVTPHVYVLDKDRKIAYMGAIDDSARKPTRHYLRDAVDALLAGKSPDRPETLQRGCAIEYEDTTAERPGAVTLAVVEPDGYKKVLAAHRGKVVLVDFWATWCLPCVRQFPHTVELSRKYADRKLAVVSMSLDEPDERDRALTFLEKQEARFDNLLSRYGGSEASYEAYAIPGGSVPHYKLYDRKGVERYTFEFDPLAGKQFTHEDIEGKLKELLAEPGEE